MYQIRSWIVVCLSLVLSACATSLVIPAQSASLNAAPTKATTFEWSLSVPSTDMTQQLAWSRWLESQTQSVLRVCLCIQPQTDATAQSLIAFRLFRQLEQDANRQGIELEASMMPSADHSAVIVGQSAAQER